VEKPEEKNHLEDRGVDGRIGLERILDKPGGVERIHPAQDRDRWWPLVNAVMNLGLWRHGVS
jgi:hypothetical protein